MMGVAADADDGATGFAVVPDFWVVAMRSDSSLTVHQLAADHAVTVGSLCNWHDLVEYFRWIEDWTKMTGCGDDDDGVHWTFVVCVSRIELRE
jgi:hypothetical protein